MTLSLLQFLALIHLVVGYEFKVTVDNCEDCTGGLYKEKYIKDKKYALK